MKKVEVPPGIIVTFVLFVIGALYKVNEKIFGIFDRPVPAGVPVAEALIIILFGICLYFMVNLDNKT